MVSKAMLFSLCLPIGCGMGLDSDVFQRYDRSDYLSRRSSSREPTSSKYERHRQRKNRSSTNEDSDDARYYSKIIIPDDPRGCALYGAQSSIPNSGLGMYTTVSPSKHEAIGLPEIGISLIDPNNGHALLANYPWEGAQLVGNTLEAESTDSIIPSLGMLANSHLGLKSSKTNLGRRASRIFKGLSGGQSKHFWGAVPWEADEPGRGASSDYYNILFEVTEEKNINIPEAMSDVGTEIFVNYGEEWFAWREKYGSFKGMMIPFERHYARADELLTQFLKDNEYLFLANLPESAYGLYGGEEGYHRQLQSALEATDLPNIASLNKDALKLVFEDKYQELYNRAEEEDPKIAFVLPPVDDINNLVKVGLSTARYSVPTSLQSTEWLENHGFCMDNMRMGRSTIPQAGMGAFAVRSMAKGSVVTATPVVTLHRDLLKIGEKSKQPNDFNRVQLLANYCFGHVNSTLLMFPYSSTIHFINHAGTSLDEGAKASNRYANVKLRWSHSEYQPSEWLEKSIEDMHNLNKAGLMIDFVATRDISIGEEILLDYGPDWIDNWNEHTTNWDQCNKIRKNEGGSSDDELPSPNIINELNKEKILRTLPEQDSSPYPSNVQTVCYLRKQSDANHGDSFTWEFTTSPEMYPCRILARSSYVDDIHLYSVLVLIDDSTSFMVENVPRYGIIFAEQSYNSNQHISCGFRHFIGLPDGMMPEHWLDI